WPFGPHPADWALHPLAFVHYRPLRPAMTSRSLRASALVLGLFALSAVAGLGCADSAVEGPQKQLKSAGMLSESRLPIGWWGPTPPRTAPRPRARSLEVGWYKLAKPGDKPPTYADRPSL